MSLFKKKSEKQAQELFLIASNSIPEMEQISGELSNKGVLEAMLFNSNVILTSQSVMQLSNYDDIQQDYLQIVFFMLKDQFKHKDDDYICDFINKRLTFYNEELNKVIRDNSYSPMFIYKTFYQTPLENNSSVFIDAGKIMTFNMGIINMIVNINSALVKFNK